MWCGQRAARKGNHHDDHHHGNHQQHDDERHCWRTGRPGCGEAPSAEEDYHRQEGRAQGQEERQGGQASRQEDRQQKKAATAAVPREFSKKQIVLDMLRRQGGATMAEIAKATDWQNHTIRGFISGTLTKKMGLAIASTKNDAGERTYKITVK